MIQQCLQNKLREMKIDREVVTLVSQVIVDKNDNSFKEPTKFIGKRFTKKEAVKMTSQHGWHFKEQEEGPGEPGKKSCLLPGHNTMHQLQFPAD